jgi:hypothetical protein
LAGLGYCSWCHFGVVGVIAYLEQRRTAKGQETIIEFVKRNVAKDISEEAIKALERQRSTMQTQVTENIPALARAAVLKEQAVVHAAALSRHFLEWKRIQDELGTSPTGGQLDPVIEATIVDRLVPRYEQEAALGAARNRITAFSVALALAGNLFPWPMNVIVIGFFSIPLVTSLVEFFRLSSEPDRWNATRRIILWSIYSVLLVVALGFAVFLLAIGDLTDFGNISMFVLFGVGLVGVALFPVVRRLINGSLGISGRAKAANPSAAQDG